MTAAARPLSAFAVAVRGFRPISGTAPLAPVGLFPPRSLAAFLVALNVGVALLLVRHLARMIG